MAEETPAPSEAQQTTASEDENVAGTRWLVDRFQQALRDASEILAFAIANGRAIDDATVEAIHAAQQHLTRPGLPDPASRSQFEAAYRDLVCALEPVTAETLRATDDAKGRKHLLVAPTRTISEAKLWSRKLSLITALVLLIIFLGGYSPTVVNHPLFEVDHSTGRSILGLGFATWQVIAGLFSAVVPFAYGALGACVFLLKSCHIRIYRREFNVRRIPEYYSRILLGFVSGGAILLFIDPQEVSTYVGSAGLAFLTGYNADFLFATLERIAAAILPKVPAPETPPSTPAAPRVAPGSPDKVREQSGQAATDQGKAGAEGSKEGVKDKP